MNKNFSNFIFNFHNCFVGITRPQQYTKDYFLKKKLSDYYYSKIIPNFYCNLPYNSQYSPHVVKSKLLYSFVGFMVIYCFSTCGVRSQSSTNKKYVYTPMTKGYLQYEEAVIKREKRDGDKIIY